jgi:uncharacterized protein YidB (DUF937 family)
MREENAMGLLDDLIGQLAGGSAQRPGAPAPQATSGPGMSTVLIALAPVVLAMLGNRQRGAQSSGPGASTGGGLGDILGKVLGSGGSSSAGMGGLGGLLEQFQRAGFGVQTRSWVGTGQNQPLPPGALEQTFGRSGLAEIARVAGVSEEDATRGLSQLLPEMVDRVTPDGQVPDGASLLANLSDLSRRLGSA